MQPKIVLSPTKSQYHQASHPSAKKALLRMIPLGGLGEIGKNMMIYETDRDILIVDCGLMFPGEEMPGIDFVIPDTTYLLDNRQKIRAMVLTHGHEDHIGAVPYIWPKFKCPIYATPLTAKLLEAKFREFNIQGARVQIFNPGQHFTIGNSFKIDSFPLSHTIPDEVGLAITTPIGLILHITDFKIEYEGDQDKVLFQKLEDFGKRKVQVLLLDSTNVELPGQSLSEKVVSRTIDSIFKEAAGRIIVTSFASNISRIQSVIDATRQVGRKLAISGRSMEKNVEIAMRLGYLKVSEDLLVDVRRVNHLPDYKIVILSTGSQGEEFSALSRMAAGEHRQVKIKPGDTVVISASAIPGNERSISNTIDNLFREGAMVIYGGEALEVHASGHAKSEDLKKVIETVKPTYFVPIHGEFRHLVLHARLAMQVEVPASRSIVAEDGQVIEFGKDYGKLSGEKIPSGYILVDGLGVGDVGNIVLRDRQAMATEGIFVVILTVDHSTGKIVTSPDIISRGFVYMRAAEDLIFKARQEVKKMFASHQQKAPMNWAYVKQAIREEMGEFLYQHTQRRPMVVPVIIEV